MIFGEMIEEIYYWALQLQGHQQVVYWAMWVLVPSFVLSLINVYFGPPALEDQWFISALLSAISCFILSLTISSPFALILMFIAFQCGFLYLISHLIRYEK